MRLIDRIVQCRSPFIVENFTDGTHTRLSGALDAAADLQRCPIRYVLDDALIALCTDLAYSHGTTIMDCADLIHVPAERVWVEWCNQPWRAALSRNGLNEDPIEEPAGGRYGLLIRAGHDGRSGDMRAFWSAGEGELDLHASATQARFRLDSPGGPPPGDARVMRVAAPHMDPKGVLSACFDFEFEESWARYYGRAVPCAAQRQEILYRSIGVVALAVPVLLAFFLLLSTRAGLPQRHSQLERLNRDRLRRGRTPLAEHIQVSVPLLPSHCEPTETRAAATRHHPRLHHVRGHLMRHHNRLIWRVPHLRGRTQEGVVKSRTVEWRFEATPAQRAERSSRGSMP